VKRIILGILVVGTFSAHANLIQNGSFENNGSDIYVNYGSWQTYNSITGWSNNGNKVEIQNNGIWTGAVAADGSKWLELDSYGSYSITSQSIAAVAGQTYNVSFAYAGRPDSPTPVDNQMTVNLNGTITNYFASNSVTPGPLNWTYGSFSFTATGSDFITFKDAGLNDSYGILLDNVSVNVAAVPEPATLGLFGIGLLAMAGAVRARTKRQA
jgi:hypothetical protein